MKIVNMATKGILLILSLVSFCFTYVKGQQKVSLVSCLEGSTATEIIATIRAEINGADILQLTAYNQAGDTPESAAECTTTTITNDILQLTLTFDTGSPTCGIAVDGVTATQFNIRVHALGTALTQPYTFSCDSTALTSTMVESGAVLVHGQFPIFGLYEKSRDVRLLTLFSGSNLPVVEAELGREVYNLLVLNKRPDITDNTNFGSKFHIGFLDTDAGATLSLDIYTPGFGAIVRVSGTLTGSEIDETFSINRDNPRIGYEILTAYQPTGTTSTWATEDKGIEIESLDGEVIGVRVNSDGGAGFTDSYVAYPDEVLGVSGGSNTYRLPTLPATGVTTAQALIVGIEDGTMVTINEDSVTSVPAGTTFPVTINALQTYHLYCGLTCQVFSVTSDKPVAVITGNGQDTLAATGTVAGHVLTPNLPTTQFGTEFVIVAIRNDLSLQAHYKTLYDTAEFTTTAVWKHEMATENIHDGSGAIVYSSMDTNFHAKELRYEGAGSASVTQFLTGTAAVEPAMVSIPPVSHWSTLYTVPVKGNTLYDILIISRNPQVKVSSNLFPAPADLNALAALAAIGTPGAYNFVPVSPVSPDPANYLMVHAQVTTDADLKWATLESFDPSVTFMLLIYEISGNIVNAFAPVGQFAKTSAQSPCAPATVQNALNAPIYPGVRRGDGIDNDCDGKEGEETLNGVDDDFDGDIDEDLHGGELPGDTGVNSIFNKGLLMAEDQPFTTPIEVIGADGCNVDTAGDAISTVGHFTVSTADNANYPNIWAIKTNTYAIFRITNKEPLYLKATVGFCEDEAGLCLDSCTTKRKRRDVANVTSARKPETVYYRVNVIDPVSDSTGRESSENSSCLHSPMYWGLVATILLIILFEMVVIATFLRKQSRLDY